MNQRELDSIVVGVDVGGLTKGFHAVALQDGQYREQLSTLRETQGTGSLFSSRYNPDTPFPPLGPSGKDR
ncbi:MAG: hypothetical protein HP498_05775 [Nitrospira sp.]|nr:hypothetical protein [Nitrospira sp.]